MSGALVVFARAPEPGRVKTRLVPPFTPEEAAALYACLLDDTLEASVRLAAGLDLAVWLAVDPPDAMDALGRRAPDGVRTVAQRGPDLGARMEHAVAEACAAGHRPVLLRGSDSPTLGRAHLEAALAALPRCDLVLSPDPDGGYGLVGLNAPAPGLFGHAMSTPSVLRDTLANARALGLRHALLPPGFDLDRAEDLARLAAARRAGHAGNCPRTLLWLDRHARWPA